MKKNSKKKEKIARKKDDKKEEIFNDINFNCNCLNCPRKCK